MLTEVIAVRQLQPQILPGHESVVVESCFISAECTQFPPKLPNGVHSVFYIFIFCFIDLFIVEAAMIEMI